MTNKIDKVLHSNHKSLIVTSKKAEVKPTLRDKVYRKSPAFKVKAY